MLVEKSMMNEKTIILGKMIVTSESLSNFISLVQGLDIENLTLVYALEENQNYNINLIFFIMFIIIIVSLIVCLLSFLNK